MNEKHKEKLEMQKLNRNDPFNKQFPLRYKFMTPELNDYKKRLKSMLKSNLYFVYVDDKMYYDKIKQFYSRTTRKSYFNQDEKSNRKLLRKKQNQFYKKLMSIDLINTEIVLDEIDEFEIFPSNFRKNYEMKMLKIIQEIALLKEVILEKTYEPHKEDTNHYKFFIKSAIVQRERHHLNNMIIQKCFEIDKISPLMYPDDYVEQEQEFKEKDTTNAERRYAEICNSTLR
jgi:hypothetical protein